MNFIDEKYLELYNQFLNKVLNGMTLNDEEVNLLKNINYKLKNKLDEANYTLCKLGTILDYNQKMNEGFNKDDIKRWHIEDSEYLNLCSEITKDNHEKRDYMFGYPANMQESSSIVNYLKILEGKNYLMNSCGDPYEQGNYQMDNKLIERKIIDLFLDKFNLNKDTHWGYITTGGTEGNVYGINNGLMKYPNANLYCFKDAHYSVSKSKVDNNKIKIIEDNDCCTMLSEIILNYQKEKTPAILFLTYGTTKNGKIDDVCLIKRVLELKKIPYYLHLDGALYAGIPNNQKGAPILNIKEISPDSLSISFHKYLGVNRCNGIVLSKKSAKDNYIDYIGQNDTTISGSRDFLAYSTYQQINEVLTRSNKEMYINNIDYLKELFKENNITYQQGIENGNIFVIDKPNDQFCLKYQLATFEEEGKEYAHVIIFPHHKKEIIKEFVNDICKNKEEILTLKKV